MISHHFDDDYGEVSDYDSINKPSYDELQDAFNIFYGEWLKLSKLNSKQNIIISYLERNSKSIQDELDKDEFKLNT